MKQKHVWYAPDSDKIFVFPFDIAQVVMDSGPTVRNPVPGVIRIEVSIKLDAGRLVHESGSVLEYIGEL